MTGLCPRQRRPRLVASLLSARVTGTALHPAPGACALSFLKAWSRGLSFSEMAHASVPRKRILRLLVTGGSGSVLGSVRSCLSAAAALLEAPVLSSSASSFGPLPALSMARALSSPGSAVTALLARFTVLGASTLRSASRVSPRILTETTCCLSPPRGSPTRRWQLPSLLWPLETDRLGSILRALQVQRTGNRGSWSLCPAPGLPTPPTCTAALDLQVLTLKAPSTRSCLLCLHHVTHLSATLPWQ